MGAQEGAGGGGSAPPAGLLAQLRSRWAYARETGILERRVVQALTADGGPDRGAAVKACRELMRCAVAAPAAPALAEGAVDPRQFFDLAVATLLQARYRLAGVVLGELDREPPYRSSPAYQVAAAESVELAVMVAAALAALCDTYGLTVPMVAGAD